MSMAWNSRFKAAWSGEVSGADLAALFAATAGLSDLQQALEDRRLAAEIDNPGFEWRAVLAVGRLAAPLWLADALVGLAGAFYDAETHAHPDRPSCVSPYIHDLVTALLAPVEEVIADVTAALADSNHRTGLTAPLRVGPGGDVAGDDVPDPVIVSYAQALLAGALRVHTSAASLLLSLRTTFAKSEPPDWVVAGMQRLDGELQAAGARLEMGDVRLTSFVGTRSADSDGLAAICRDLWMIVGVSFAAGQTLSDPHLLPEASAARSSAPTKPTTSTTIAMPSAPPRRILPPPAPVKPFTLPQIEAGAAPLRERRNVVPPTAEPPIQPPLAPPAPLSLPVIGESSPRQTSATQPSSKPPHGEQRRPETGKAGADEDPTVLFPDIG